MVGVGDFAAQAEKVFQNLGEALASAGASFDDVVKVTIYLTDMKNRPELLRIRTKYFKRDPPASTLVQVASLVRPEFMLEIEAVAVIE